eukprot:scaffold2534_cov260-Pinguiococcus_pyrenoidosus.AAC.31
MTTLFQGTVALLGNPPPFRRNPPFASRRTAENFRLLCERKKYADVPFHRIIPSFMVQGGDFTRGDGRGGESAWGGKFADENFRKKHSRAGLLSMANAGPNTNGSQFFVTLAATPHLDGKHVVFGEVTGGIDVLRKMEKVCTAPGQRWPERALDARLTGRAPFRWTRTRGIDR